MYDLKSFYGPNAGYVLEQYERYQQDPSSVDPATRAIFDNWPTENVVAESRGGSQPHAGTLSGEEHSVAFAPDLPGEGQRRQVTRDVEAEISRTIAAAALAHAIRERGHLAAHLDPLGTSPLGDPALLPETFGIHDENLASLPPNVVGGHAAEGVSNAREAVAALRAMYSGTISYEFDQVKDPHDRLWLRDAVGLNLYRRAPTPTSSRQLLQRLTQVEAFERYLQQTYPGQKRFSLEGTDVLVPMLDEIIRGAIESATHEVLIGMAHRGRLNVLAHVLEKPYSVILAEFAHQKHEEGVPLTDTFGFGYTGDVKYHLGAEHLLGESASVSLKVILAPNPSHLEFVNPVIEGMTRASQEIVHGPGLPLQDADRAVPILIHGDAAFPGEGVVAETLNLWRLRGYWVGGTIHIIVNNQLGFTTDPQDSRSTHFASDLAKGFEIPIIHVNADDPDAALTAVRLAYAYREECRKDILIDLVGYRRWGHNEGDEPAFTQPRMYEIIRKHPTVRQLYAQKLEHAGLISPGEADTMLKDALALLEQAKNEADNGLSTAEQNGANGVDGHHDLVGTPPAVTAEQLIAYNTELLSWPQGFSPNNKLVRLLQRRATTLGSEGGIDWGQAEALAFASILADGTPIRLTGQDTERGTFSHRHAVLHNERTGEIYVPLQHLSQARAPFSIYNSPLSESAALGFEYGYSVHAPNALVLWEAQFGDFANVAQVIIDQFIASARAKWRQDSSLVLLLPHGYEGQGPEHSSARLERYLQLSAGNNWSVANCSTAAQYFHLLRRQVFYLERMPRPLIIMTPKSLLRHPFASAKLQDLVQGTFQPVIDDQAAFARANTIRKLVLCTGKVAIDLLSYSNRAQAEDVAIVRVEMLYPFPADELKRVMANYPSVREVVWVQEEPRNMGAWGYISPLLTSLVNPNIVVSVVSRPERSSPAEGLWELHIAEQEQIITEALRSSVKQYGGKHVS